MASSSQPPKSNDVRLSIASSSQPPNVANWGGGDGEDLYNVGSSSQRPNVANWGGGHGEDLYNIGSSSQRPNVANWSGGDGEDLCNIGSSSQRPNVANWGGSDWEYLYNIASSSQRPNVANWGGGHGEDPCNIGSSSQRPNVANWGGGHGKDLYKWKEELPVGIKFRPTEHVLIKHYLFFRSIGKTFPPGIISDEEVYDYPPYILQERGFKHDDGRMYFFTRVRRKDNSVKKSDRSVKDVGFWKATQAREDIHEIINNKKTVIGARIPLAYFEYSVDQNGEKVVNEKGQRMPRKQNWLMIEYRLKYAEPPDVESALCVVYYHHTPKKERRSKIVKRTQGLFEGGGFGMSNAQGRTEEPQ